MSEWSVVLGRLHQNASNPQEVRVMITNVTRSNSSGVSNVVVLKLASKPTLTDHIQPICLDDGQKPLQRNNVLLRRLEPGGNSVCVSFPFHQMTTLTKCLPLLYRAVLPVFVSTPGDLRFPCKLQVHRPCAQTLQETQTSVVSCGNTSSANSLCTGTFTLTQGEYGGPLMCKVSSSWFQAVVLFNTNSTTRANMMTFEKVSAFKDFLRSTVGEFLSPAASTTAAPTNSTNSTVSTTSSGPALTAGPALLASHLLLALLGLLLFT
ncbi:hypothetical protein WMY93_001863 [Mugilogobius chulae]|uniref:Uncharacterized protein n=1 Tax=Mugilogobius chulae TaxID=88201 RepID=A0AAW0PVI6_9GOBI